MRSALACAVFCLALICQLLSGCGGGGGGDDQTEFAGVWSGNASLVEDTCGVILPEQQFIFFTHLVSQNGTEIVLDNGFLTFVGAVQSETSFTAATEKDRVAVPGTNSCREKITFRYESVIEDQAQFVVRSSDVSCTTGGTTFQCKFAFSGSAFRATPPGVTPRPLPVEGDGGIGDGSGPVGDAFDDERSDGAGSVDQGATSEGSL